MTEVIERTVNDTQLSIRLNICEVCLWFWPSPPERIPVRCAHCDSRRWDGVPGEIVAVPAETKPKDMRKVATELRRKRDANMPEGLSRSEQLRWMREHS